MADITSPHDRFFREMLSHREAARDFVRHYLPAEVVKALDLDSLEITKDSFVTPELRAHHSDLVYRVQLAEGGSGFLYLLFEHKSRPDPTVALQLLRYITRLWDQYLRQSHGLPLPPVVPVVFYHGRARWEVGTDFAALLHCPKELEPYVPRFRYALTDLSRYTDDQIRGTAYLQVAFLALRNIFEDDVARRIPAILRVLEDLVRSGTGLEALEAVLRYFASASERVGAEELRKAVDEAFPEQGEKIMSTLAERWIEEGKRQGLQQGLQQGSAATAREAVVEALEARFDVIPRTLLEQIERAEDLALLKMLLKKAVTCPALEDFRAALEIALS